MVFSSLEFLTIFLPAVILLYYASPSRLRNSLLLFFSLVFYAWGEPVYVLIMVFSIVMNYLFGLGIYKTENSKKLQKTVLALSVIANLGMLGVFKYSNFAIDNINALFGTDIPAADIALPIGISFFTFQAMSYVFDVYRHTAQVQKNVFNFGLYISLFPQLIAGPIVRYSTVADEINCRTVSFDKTAYGIKRFLTGLAKKVLLANNIGYLWSQLSAQGSDLSACSAWLCAIAYTFQIYFDFSGYSDMAIGLGHIFGFTFLENFDYPYISKSITEFWRRWHISLSTWFKEYLYIPLGGNRKGTVKQIRNILIVWLLTGLWHGASWNFALWGLYYGFCLLFEKFILNKFIDKIPSVFRHIYTIIIVIFGWVLFSVEDTSMLAAYLGSMFGANGFSDASFAYNFTSNVVLLAVLIIASTPIGAKTGNAIKNKLSKHQAVFSTAEIIWYVILFVLCVAYLVDSTYNPFIYFRF